MTATIVAPTVMEAEAAAKAVLILGGEEGLKWIELILCWLGSSSLKMGIRFIASELMSICKE